MRLAVLAVLLSCLGGCAAHRGTVGPHRIEFAGDVYYTRLTRESYVPRNSRTGEQEIQFVDDVTGRHHDIVSKTMRLVPLDEATYANEVRALSGTSEAQEARAEARRQRQQQAQTELE